MFEIFRSIIKYFSTDPSDSWNPEICLNLLFDLENRRLNGIGFGESYNSLKVFGKPTNEKPLYNRVFNFQSLGLLFEIDERENLDFFSLVFQNEEHENFYSSKASLKFPNSREFQITRETTNSEISANFGDPKEIDRDDEEIVLFYYLFDLNIEFELNLKENLKRMNVMPDLKKAK